MNTSVPAAASTGSPPDPTDAPDPTDRPRPIGPGRSRLPDPVQILLAVVVLFLSIFLAQGVTLIPGVRGLVADDPNGSVAIFLSCVLLILPTGMALALLVLLLRLDGGRRLSMIGWRPQRRGPITLLAGVAVSIVALLGPALVLSNIGLLRPPEQAFIDRYAGLPGWVIVLNLLLVGFTLQAIPEELIFRGYLLRSLRTGRTAAILLSSGVFGLLHLVSGGGQQGILERFLYLALPLGFGFAAATLSLRWDSLWAAIGIHGGLHIGYPITYTLALGDGPWLWCTAGLAWTIVGVLAWKVPKVNGR